MTKDGYVEVGFERDGALVMASKSLAGHRLAELRQIRLSIDNDAAAHAAAVRQAFAEICAEKWAIEP